jgi:putative PIG3 family NAD(P)H quinone oxidoreductase
MQVIEHGVGGPPETLRLAKCDRPTPGEDEVLIEVAYAGVNRPDVLQRSGSYPPPPDASPVIGLEVSGRVAAVGGAVTEWQVDDAVCALTPGGGYAEFCVAPAAHCLPIPQGLSLLQAAALPENVFTVWANVFMLGRLASGESFLVHGGASGIGYTAIQLARAAGATVFTTAGSADKVAFCKRIGAAYAFDYTQQDWGAALHAATGKRGVDLILDMVGGDYCARNLRALAVEGRLMQIAFLQGSKVEIDALPIMLKRLTWGGSTLRARPKAAKTEIRNAVLANAWPIIARGDFEVVIHEVFPLAHAAAAHRLMESNRHIGKLMLRVGG